MFEGLEEEGPERLIVFSNLQNFVREYEGTVQHSLGSYRYNTADYALFIVSHNGANQNFDNDILEHFEGYTIHTFVEGSAVDTNLIFMLLLPIALALLLIILFVFCESLFEPVLIFICVIVAIALNMGSNIFFNLRPHGVSDLVFQIAPVLQLILSIDYSLIILKRYRQEKLKMGGLLDKKLAMKRTLKSGFKTVFSASMTSFLSLFALLFMTFTIGIDMGIVFAKGVLMSIITVFTVLPAITLWTDKAIEKGNKKAIAARWREKRKA